MAGTSPAMTKSMIQSDRNMLYLFPQYSFFSLKNFFGTVP
jgi:hypothetical protein